MDAEQEGFFASLDGMTPVEARNYLQERNFTGRHGVWKREWLATDDQRLSEADRASNRAERAEEIEIARSAANAAWEAARAAKNANTIATVALIASVIAIAVSIISAFVQHH